MKFTLSWLKDHLDTTASVDEIAEGLVGVGLEVEEISDLSSALHAINLGQSEMDKAIQAGDDEMVDNAKADEGSSNFDSARFSSSR